MLWPLNHHVTDLFQSAFSEHLNQKLRHWPGSVVPPGDIVYDIPAKVQRSICLIHLVLWSTAEHFLRVVGEEAAPTFSSFFSSAFVLKHLYNPCRAYKRSRQRQCPFLVSTEYTSVPRLDWSHSCLPEFLKYLWPLNQCAELWRYSGSFKNKGLNCEVHFYVFFFPQ